MDLTLKRHGNKMILPAGLIKHIFMPKCASVDFDQRYSAYPTPTYPSDSVSLAKNSKDMNGKTKSARNFI